MLEVIQRLDEQVLEWIAGHLRGPLLDPFMVFYTSLGNSGWIFIAAGVVMLLFRRTRRAGASSLLAMVFGLLVTNLTLKPLVARPRPWMVMEDFVTLAASGDMNSFPSGHTCAAFAFAVALWAVLPQKWARAAALAAAALMGFSRLYVGVHFPSDVLAGALVGALCGLLGAWAVEKVTGWYRSRTTAK